MCIFNKIFRLASLTDVIPIHSTTFCVGSNHAEGWPLRPLLTIKIIYNCITIHELPIPNIQEKALYFRQKFSSKLVRNITIFCTYSTKKLSGRGFPDPSISPKLMPTVLYANSAISQYHINKSCQTNYQKMHCRLSLYSHPFFSFISSTTSKAL